MNSRPRKLLRGMLIGLASGVLFTGLAEAGVNDDGNTDAVFANIDLDQTNRVCLGDGLGGFTCSDTDANPAASRDVGLGDLNGDGFIDAAFAQTGEPNRACLGDGAGGFTCSQVSADEFLTLGMDIGYINLDGFLDLVFANMDSRDRVCLGDGSGAFTCSDVSTGSDITSAVALGYIDSDSFLDAVFANGILASTVCLGDGAAGFSCSNIRAETASSVDVALGDLNGDGDLDAFLVNTDKASWVCLGDGTGSFACSDFAGDTNSISAVALGDLDRDDRLDAVLAAGAEPNRVCLGDGAGSFTCAPIDEDDLINREVSLGDINRDGKLDAVFAVADWRNRVCLGNGTGEFVCSDLSTDTNNSWGVALAGVAPPPALSLSKTSTTIMVSETGQVVDYRYVVRNLGPITAHDVALEDDNVDAPPVCSFSGADELAPAGAPGSLVACQAQHTATLQEVGAEGSLDNTVTARSDETPSVMTSLSIPIGLWEDGFEASACPCWTQSDLNALPLAGETADCGVSQGRVDLFQIAGCEYSYAASFSELGSSCIAQRFACPDLGDLEIQIETDDGQFFACLEQIVDRCEDLGIEPPPFP
jgi:hypothetical protein